MMSYSSPVIGCDTVGLRRMNKKLKWTSVLLLIFDLYENIK